jgi:hypothetical protein
MDGHLDDLQATPGSPVVHLDLEAVAVALDAGDIDGLQRRGPPELKTGGNVPDTQPQERTDVGVGKG